MSWSRNYLNSLKREILSWGLAAKVEILKEKFPAEIDAGFMRIKITLQNADILELSEYVIGDEAGVIVKSYAYHWQDASGNLKKRWDNAKHHLKVSSYPDHLHDGNEQNVIASEAMSFSKIKQLIEREIKGVSS